MQSTISGILNLGSLQLNLKTGFQQISRYGSDDISVMLVGKIYTYDKRDADLQILTELFSAYRKYSTKFFERLSGEFILFIEDKQKKTIYIAGDHVGTYSFYYHVNERDMVFADFLPQIILLQKSIHLEKNEEWIRHFLVNKTVPTDQTVYKQISKLKPGSYLKIHQNNVTENSYYDIRRRRIPINFNNEEIFKRFDQLLLQSVQKRLCRETKAGSELSGGLDSTGITGILKNFLPDQNQLFTYSHSLKDTSKYYPFLNEEKFIEIAKKGMNLTKHFYSYAIDKGILERLRQLTSAIMQPVQFRYVLFLDEMLERAQDEGVQTMFSGFGGDELITSHASGIQNEYLKQFKLRKYFRYKRNKLTLRRIIGDILSAFLPKMFFRYRQRRPNLFQLRMLLFPIRDELKHNLRIKELAQSIYFPYQSRLSEREYDRITRDHIQERIQMTNVFASQYGITYKFPFWDKELMEFYYSLPLEYKYRGGYGRYIYRKVIEKYIPKDLAWRKDKTGATIPNVLQRYMNDFEEITAYIEYCKENAIGHMYFDYDALLIYHKKIKTKATEGDGEVYFGIMINYLSLLMFLEMFEEKKTINQNKKEINEV